MKNIKADECKKMCQENPNCKCINVLPEEDFEKEHIPNSINIPVEEEDFLDQIKNQNINKNDQIIVYCASNECPASTEAAKKLEKAGYKNVCDFKGGMQEWREAGNPVTAGVS